MSKKQNFNQSNGNFLTSSLEFIKMTRVLKEVIGGKGENNILFQETYIKSQQERKVYSQGTNLKD